MVTYNPDTKFMGRRDSHPMIVDRATRDAIADEAISICRACSAVLIGHNTKMVLDREGAVPNIPAFVWPHDHGTTPDQYLSLIRRHVPRGDLLVLGGLKTFKTFAGYCDQVTIFHAVLDENAGEGEPLFFTNVLP